MLFASFSFQVPFHGESAAAAKQGDTAASDSTAAHAQHNSFFIGRLVQFEMGDTLGPGLRSKMRHWSLPRTLGSHSLSELRYSCRHSPLDMFGGHRSSGRGPLPSDTLPA